VKPDLVVRAAAAADIEDAHAWYERARRDNPVLYPVVHRDARRALLPRFPYALFYRPEPDRILVIACFHAKRDPLVWQSRR
jgi:plasmid stabilization system protein ParE